MIILCNQSVDSSKIANKHNRVNVISCINIVITVKIYPVAHSIIFDYGENFIEILSYVFQ